MRSLHIILPILLLALATGAVRPAAADLSPAAGEEYPLKAVFLLQFAQFVRWPPPTVDEELVVGVLGIDPFGQVLEDALAGERVGGTTVRIERWREVGEVGVCHILFVSASEADRLDDVLVRLGDRPVLTVGDSDGFAEAGGIIGFFIRHDRIRFRINLQRARALDLEISSRLLDLAEIVDSPGRGGHGP